MERIAETLRAAGACDEALAWAETLPEGTDAQGAWGACPRADWLFWWLGRTDAPRAEIARAAIAVVRLAPPYAAAADAAEMAEARRAIDTAEAYLGGRASPREVQYAAFCAERSAAALAGSAAWLAYAASDAAAAAIASGSGAAATEACLAYRAVGEAVYVAARADALAAASYAAYAATALAASEASAVGVVRALFPAPPLMARAG